MHKIYHANFCVMSLERSLYTCGFIYLLECYILEVHLLLNVHNIRVDIKQRLLAYLSRENIDFICCKCKMNSYICFPALGNRILYTSFSSAFTCCYFVKLVLEVFYPAA